MKASEIIGTSLVREGRKNPKLNPKIPVDQYVNDHLEKAEYLPGTNIKNSFVSFTEVDKLGVNPGSTWDTTPLGIYAYPSRIALDNLELDEDFFADDKPYANIFSAKGNIVDLDNMTRSDLDRYTRAMVDVYFKLSNIKKGSKNANDKLKDIISYSKKTDDDFDTYQELELPSEDGPGGEFWYISEKISEILPTTSGSRHPIRWNKLFREIGIDGCIDNAGDGIIHKGEPEQIVFFSYKPIIEVKRVYNRSSYDLKFNKKKAKLNQMSEDELIKAVQKDSTIFQYIKNPSEAVQLAAVQTNTYIFKDIENPSEAVQLAAVQQYGGNIKYIENPSEAVQLAAVKEGSGFAIKYIKNPSEAVQLAAVKQGSGLAIKYIKNPSEAVQLAAVKENPNATLYIENPSDKVKAARSFKL